VQSEAARDLGAVFRPRSALCHAGRAVSVGAFWDAAGSTDGPVSDLGTFLGRIAS